MKFFSDNIVASLSALSVRLTQPITTFITKNAYSAFQLARIYKIKAIYFEDMFNKEIFGYAKKSGIRISFNTTLVNDENKQLFADFAKNFYNPIEKHPNSLNVYSSHRDLHEVVDISSYKAGDKLVFYSNMEDNHVDLKNTGIVGFSRDKSIFSGSKKIRKQIKISQKQPKPKRPLPTYSNDDLAKLMSNEANINFSHIKFLMSMMEDLMKVPMFKSMLGSASAEAMKLLKKFPIFIDSMTMKEVMRPKLFANNSSASRIKRISRGSGVEQKLVQRLIEFVLMISQHGIKGSTEELRKKASSDPRLSQMMNQFGPLLKMFGK